ncbi:hypothetical protein SODG_007200 [Sodalis praecaptivus]
MILTQVEMCQRRCRGREMLNPQFLASNHFNEALDKLSKEFNGLLFTRKCSSDSYRGVGSDESALWLMFSRERGAE